VKSFYPQISHLSSVHIPHFRGIGFSVSTLASEGMPMTEPMENRACKVAVYMIETGASVRSAARHFGISKSTVHKDLSCRLQQYNYALYVQVRRVLDKNKQERHIRGGMATKRKYKGN